MLASRIEFDAGDTCLTFYGADIRSQLVTGDPLLARATDEQTAALIASFSRPSVARDVVANIVTRLPDGPPSQHQIASDLAMSNRTLQRKLKDEGVSFNDLLQDTRLQLARRYLGQATRSIAETTYLLGFSEPSAFSRAFKRWTGESPARYRDQTLDL